MFGIHLFWSKAFAPFLPKHLSIFSFTNGGIGGAEGVDVIGNTLEHGAVLFVAYNGGKQWLAVT